MDEENVLELHRTWAHVSPRQVPIDDWDRYEGYVAEIFSAFGMDLDTPGTRDTPGRFLRALFDAVSYTHLTLPTNREV